MAKSKVKAETETTKHAGGRPSKYDAVFHPLLVESLARNGLINPQIAERMGIATSTLSKWMNDYPEFSDALKRGREEPDEKVESSLLKRATGYRYQEVTKEVKVKEGDEPELTVTKVVTKELPPDPTSMIFWLKNRRPDRWRDKQDINLSGMVETASLTPEERRRRIAELEAKRANRK